MTIEDEAKAAIELHIKAAEELIADAFADGATDDMLLQVAGELRVVRHYIKQLSAPPEPGEKKVFFSRRGLERIAKHLGRVPTPDDLDAVRSGAIRVP